MRFYENYWKDKQGHLSDFDLKWPKLKKYIPLEQNIVIADFGCGSGEILKEIIKINQHSSYIGIDVSQAALDESEKKLSGSKTRFIKIIDGEPFPVEDKSVDFVFSSEVIEHIYDTENAFKELARILKPNGKLLLTTPYHGLIKNILIVLFAFNKHFNPTGSHIRFFTKKTLFEMLKNNGFEIIKYGFYGRFYPLSHSIFVLAKKS